LILCFELQKLIFVCGQAVRQTAVAAAKTAGKPKEATHLGALAVAHFFEKEKKAALETKAAADKAAAAAAATAAATKAKKDEKAAAVKAKEAVKAAAAAADPKKAKQKQQQAICSQRCYRKSKGRENWTAADIAADAADAENLLAAEEKAAAAVAADPKKAKRKQEQAIRSRRCYKKSKGRKNSTEHSR